MTTCVLYRLSTLVGLENLNGLSVMTMVYAHLPLLLRGLRGALTRANEGKMGCRFLGHPNMSVYVLSSF